MWARGGHFYFGETGHLHFGLTGNVRDWEVPSTHPFEFLTPSTHQAWARHGHTWSSLGTVEPDAGGSTRLIAEGPALSVLPDGLTVTVEPRTGNTAPSGRVVVAWAP